MKKIILSYVVIHFFQLFQNVLSSEIVYGSLIQVLPLPHGFYHIAHQVANICMQFFNTFCNKIGRWYFYIYIY